MINAKKAERANKIEMTMVEINKTFSNPRRVWWTELKLSPPKALPRLASDCCSKITATRRTARTISM